MGQSDTHVFGDTWYDLNYTGLSYLFIKGTSASSSVTFNFGVYTPISQWVLYVAVSLGVVLTLGCLFICFCYVRRLARKRAEEANKVRKYATGREPTTEEKVSRYKYGRQSAPITLPNIEENNDEMQKPNDEWGVQDYESSYKGQGY